MVFRSQRMHLLARILLIAFFLAVVIYALYQPKWYVVSIVSGIAVILLIINLFRFIDRTNLEFIHLLESLRYEDFTRTYRRKFQERSFRKLESSFREIQEHYKGARMEQARQDKYLQMVIEHIPVALLCFSETGRIVFYNNAAVALFQASQPDSLKYLRSSQPELYRSMTKLQAGQRELIRMNVRNEILQIAVKVSSFRMGNEAYRLVSFQDIRQELEEQELDTWQKLIRVLTHEIMNSVTPVSSLSEAINELLHDSQGRVISLSAIDPEDLNDMVSSLETIENRSKGLLKFVSDYKHLTRLPKPVFEPMETEVLLGHMMQLYQRDLEKEGIDLQMDPDREQLRIYVDKQMIEQVLINLINNAKEALEDMKERRIMLSVRKFKGHVRISVKDTGRGIDPDVADNLFIPFFTTRKHGSGIGLSLSRQIMRLHKGSIHFQTDAESTTFYLQF